MNYLEIRVVATVCFAILLITSAVSADEPFGVKLMRPDSLAGWNYGDCPPKGWTIAEGKLTGKPGAVPLLSGFTAGAFELRLQWSVGKGGTLKLLFPEVPEGEGLQLVLCEGQRCGRLADGRKELAPGAKVEALKNKMHTAAISRTGKSFSLAVDGKPLYQVDVGPQRRFGLGLAADGGEVTLAELRGLEPLGKPIFNGKDLSGWWCPGNINAWKAENNELVLQGRGGNYIRTEKLYGNFTLSCEIKMRKRGNSGVGIRTPRNGWPSGDGIELQLLDRPLSEPPHKSSYMAVYGNMPPLGRADQSEQYNQVVVKADGWMLSVWVNGELVQQCNTFDHPELKHRHLEGWIGFQDHGAWIRVRNIRVLEAPQGRGLDAWYRPKPRRAAAVILDRLMNPESLSIDDGIRSAVAVGKVSAQRPGEHVLAELTGPGALVRVAGTGSEGRMAFYFNGDRQPRIECRPDELARALPLLSEDASRTHALPTCVTYRKALTVVLREAKAAEYRFDFVTFPKDLVVESFTDPKSGFPPGWLSAALYRTRRFRVSWGGPRENDPLPRIESERKTIAPAQAVPLIRVEGAGVVKWLRLLADKKLLENNDLWLEVTADGENAPAVAAPARYWFPGLAGGGNYTNFMMVARGNVLHNMLAMPFADGITISASNHGNHPIKDVAVMISLERAAGEQVAGRLRLRGVFQSAGEGNDLWVDQKGSGRWVALVCEPPEGEPTGIAELVVDGRAREGWAAANLDTFLGGQGEFRAPLAGRQKGLCWRYLALAPVEFRKSLRLKADGKKVGNRLALFYLKK